MSLDILLIDPLNTKCKLQLKFLWKLRNNIPINEDDETKSTSFPVWFDYDDRVENRLFNIDPLLQEVFVRTYTCQYFTVLIHPSFHKIWNYNNMFTNFWFSWLINELFKHILKGFS